MISSLRYRRYVSVLVSYLHRTPWIISRRWCRAQLAGHEIPNVWETICEFDHRVAWVAQDCSVMASASPDDGSTERGSG
jgi:hypothetical protein